MARPVKHKRRNLLFRLGELFDASALGLVTLLLLGASFFATWRGMGDFIASHDLAAGPASQGLVVMIVATLSLAMYVALREMISPYYVNGWWAAVWKRLVAGVLYMVLALWSVGFGYGFWWSLVAGQDATERALEETVASIGEETSDVRARLVAAQSVMSNAEQLSDAKAEQEAARGGTCGVNSPAGTGPLARARGETQAQIAVLARSVREDWQGPLEQRLAGLERGLQVVLNESAASGSREQGGPGTSRKSRFEALGREVQIAAREIGADATARGRTIAAQLRAKAEQLSAGPENGQAAYCYDPDLAASLNAAGDELDQTYEIEVAAFEFAEGPDGVARAIEDLLANTAGLADFIPRGSQAPGRRALGGRDLVALMAALGVDLALFVFALLRGGRAREDWPLEGEAADEDIISIEVGETSQKKLPGLSGARPDESQIIDAEFERVDAGKMVNTFDPGSQLDEREQIEDLLNRVQHLMESMRAATLTAQRTPLRNQLSDALRALRKRGYFETGASDKYYAEGLHEVISTQPGDKPEGYILTIIRPRFNDAEGRLREKALVIVSAGPEPI